MSKVIIVCGLSGSGKTSLASKLSEELNVACLHKDSIKEALYEILNCSTLEDSKRLGSQSVNLLLSLAEEHIKRKVDIIIESPFNFPEDYPLFQRWIVEYGINLYSVICFVDKETRRKRFETRERHRSHHDLKRNFQNKKFDYMEIPGKQIRIETSESVEKLVNKIICEIQNT